MHIDIIHTNIYVYIYAYVHTHITHQSPKRLVRTLSYNIFDEKMFVFQYDILSVRARARRVCSVWTR